MGNLREGEASTDTSDCLYVYLYHVLQVTYLSIVRRSYGRDFTAPCIALAVINMFYYSSSIIWPTMINAFYTAGGQPWQRAAVLSLPQGCGVTLGTISYKAI